MTPLDFLDEAGSEFSSTPLFIGSGSSDLNQEARNNEHALSITAAQAQRLSVTDLRQLLHRVIAAKKAQLLRERGTSYPMTFYCWHDEQAAQLRFSLVSAAATALPFACRLLLVADIEAILRPFLASHHLDGIPWHELDAVAQQGSPADFDAEYALEVWQTWL